MPYLTSNGGYILEKAEGLLIAGDGTMSVSTDNECMDEQLGEPMFFAIATQ